MTTANSISNKTKKIDIALQKVQVLENIIEELARRINTIYEHIHSKLEETQQSDVNSQQE